MGWCGEDIGGRKGAQSSPPLLLSLVFEGAFGDRTGNGGMWGGICPPFPDTAARPAFASLYPDRPPSRDHPRSCQVDVESARGHGCCLPAGASLSLSQASPLNLSGGVGGLSVPCFTVFLGAKRGGPSYEVQAGLALRAIFPIRGHGVRPHSGLTAGSFLVPWKTRVWKGFP